MRNLSTRMKLVATGLACSLFLGGMITAYAATNAWKDVADSHWANAAIGRMTNAGLIKRAPGNMPSAALQARPEFPDTKS